MPKFQSRLLSVCVLFATTSISPAFAQSVEIPAKVSSASAVSSGGATPATVSPVSVANTTSPYQLKLQYTGEAWDNAEGGLRTGTVYMQNVDAQMRINTDKAFGWTGGEFLVDGFWNSSRSLDKNYTGAAQDPSIIDTSGVSMFRLYQAYYDQNIASTGTDLRVGIYDIETEFGNTRPMDLFFNGGYAWTSTLDQSGTQGLNGPSNYPNTSLALRASQKINDQWSVQGAVADGMSDSAKYAASTDVELRRTDGALLIGEVDYKPSKYTTLMAGYWDYTSLFVTQNQANPDGSARSTYGSDGGYLGGTTRLWQFEGRRGLDGFVNIGFADPMVNEITETLNTGLTFTGPLDARPNDKIGLAASLAGVGDPYRKAQIAAGSGVEHTETNFEMTYRAPINDWLTVQPDIQYWIHPNADPTLKNDLLFGVHFEIGHLFNL